MQQMVLGRSSCISISLWHAAFVCMQSRHIQLKNLLKFKFSWVRFRRLMSRIKKKKNRLLSFHFFSLFIFTFPPPTWNKKCGVQQVNFATYLYLCFFLIYSYIFLQIKEKVETSILSISSLKIFRVRYPSNQKFLLSTPGWESFAACIQDQ